MSGTNLAESSDCIRGIVGLGNPGSRYARSRHNAGFLVLDRLHEKYSGSGWSRKPKGWVTRLNLQGNSLILLKPTTFMNLSGEAVSDFMRFYKIHPAETLVVHDDLDIDLRQVRVKFGGSHGGHKGVQSVIESLNTDEFLRIRIGIGRPTYNDNTVDFVLSSPENVDEEADFLQSLDLAVSAVETVILENHRTAMERFNRKNKQTLMNE
ncbi:aminoacyl-tRNA hydrolase [bacterium]|nr:aminoacyl-tRNA hydrolase [candidate division CSSED10-310 bacterium]